MFTVQFATRGQVSNDASTIAASGRIVTCASILRPPADWIIHGKLSEQLLIFETYHKLYKYKVLQNILFDEIKLKH